MKCKKGFKKKGNKCVKAIGSILKSSKKSYNPFKMWGSYVGVVIYGIIIGIGFTGLYPKYFYPILLKIILFPIIPFKFLINLTGCVGEECWGYGILFGILGAIIIGFLIGYGIHSLIRRLRK